MFSVIHGPQEECVRALRNGHLLGISPGGVREALFSDETYPLLWGQRKGFAQVAIDSQVVRCWWNWLSQLFSAFIKSSAWNVGYYNCKYILVSVVLHYLSVHFYVQYSCSLYAIYSQCCITTSHDQCIPFEYLYLDLLQVLVEILLFSVWYFFVILAVQSMHKIFLSLNLFYFTTFTEFGNAVTVSCLFVFWHLSGSWLRGQRS